MKKIITILFGLMIFSSCEKEKITESETLSLKKAAFGGMLSSRGKLTINGKPASLNVIYDVKKGDVLKFIDPGDDWVTPPSFDLSGNQVGGGLVQHGLTYGEIIIESGSVANSQGSVDVNLSYIVK